MTTAAAVTTTAGITTATAMTTTTTAIEMNKYGIALFKTKTIPRLRHCTKLKLQTKSAQKEFFQLSECSELH